MSHPLPRAFPATPLQAPVLLPRATEVASVAFEAADGFPLRGVLYRGGGDGPAVLVSSAAAVRCEHYGAFAEALVAAGASKVLAYDYRGVGRSQAPAGWKARLSMHDWGAQDMDAAARLLTRLDGGRRPVGIGQSIGGTMLGLCPGASRFRRYATVASGNGYLGNTDEALKLFLAMNLAAVPVSWATGRVPGWLGIGETLPGTIFRDWARWCRRPGFLFDDPATPGTRGFAQLDMPLLCIGATDDPWTTRRAVAAMLSYMPAAPAEELWFSPADAHAGRIGHLGFFRPRFATTLWPRVIGWLLDGPDPQA